MGTSAALARSYFERSTLRVARELVGTVLVRQIGREKHTLVIAETEAYIGESDLACHARFGRTSRNAVMYGPAGVWYLYLIYGLHWMLNVVTEGQDRPAAVLIRSAIMSGTGTILQGPGNLTKALKIDAGFYGKSALSGALHIEPGNGPRLHILRTPRIGIPYAGIYRDKKWRFVCADLIKKSPGRSPRTPT